MIVGVSQGKRSDSHTVTARLLVSKNEIEFAFLSSEVVVSVKMAAAPLWMGFYPVHTTRPVKYYNTVIYANQEPLTYLAVFYGLPAVL